MAHVDDFRFLNRLIRHQDACAFSRGSLTLPTTQADAIEKVRAVSSIRQSPCDDDSILRNEANNGLDDLRSCGRHPEGDAPRTEASAAGVAGRASSTPATHPLSPGTVPTFSHLCKTKSPPRQTTWRCQGPTHALGLERTNCAEYTPPPPNTFCGTALIVWC
jgi:hypothetical protein